MLRAASAVHFRDRTFALLGKIVDEELPSGPAANARMLLKPQMRTRWDVKMADAEVAVTMFVSGSPRSHHTAPAPAPPHPRLLLDPASAY
jgi:hypothetical protein